MSKYLKVNSLKDYFFLPKQDREKKIFYFLNWYLIPYALPTGKNSWLHLSRLLNDDGSKREEEEGWTEFYEYVKKTYPVQYFFRETIPSLISDVRFFIKWYNIKEFYYNYIRTIIYPHNSNLRKVVSRKYTDKQLNLINCNFAIVKDLVEARNEYNGLDNLYSDYLTIPPSGNKDNDLINGIDEKWYNFRNQLFNCYKYITIKRPELEKQINNAYPSSSEVGTYEQLYGKLNSLEKQLEEMDTLWLKWIIDNREYFWT